VSAVSGQARWEVLHASCKDYFIHAGYKRHITPQGAGVATGPVKFVVEALRRLVRLDLETGPGRWEIGPFAHTSASVVGVSVDPSVVGRGWSPASSNKARGYCCRTPGDHRAPLQPGRAAGRYLRARRYSAALGGPGPGFRPGCRRSCASCTRVLALL
jgi:hypothetical protein